MLLYLTAIFLFLLFAPVAIVYTFFKQFSLNNPNKPFKAGAIVIDIIGNYIGEDLFNDFLVKEEYLYVARFGLSGETISSVLGKHVKFEYKITHNKIILIKNVTSLSYLGNLLVNLLDNLDKNHCLNSIKYVNLDR